MLLKCVLPRIFMNARIPADKSNANARTVEWTEAVTRDIQSSCREEDEFLSNVREVFAALVRRVKLDPKGCCRQPPEWTKGK